MYYSRWDWGLSAGIKQFFYCKHAKQPDDKRANKDWNQKFQEAG